MYQIYQTAHNEMLEYYRRLPPRVVSRRTRIAERIAKIVGWVAFLTWVFW
jgi:hypothetical protein